SFAKGLFLSMPGSLAVGFAVILSAAVCDAILPRAGSAESCTAYGIFFMILLLAAVLAGRFLGMYAGLEKQEFSLEQKACDCAERMMDVRDEAAAAQEKTASYSESLAAVTSDLEEMRRAAAFDAAMAAHVQESFLPKRPPHTGKWDISFAFKPMSGVSGDFYDFYYNDDGLWGASLFDVSGHGISSGLISLLARSIISHRFQDGGDDKLTRVMELANGDLIGEIGNIDNYLTGIIVRFNGDMVEYVNAGHSDLLYRLASSRSVKAVEPRAHDFRGSFLGVAEMENDFTMIAFKMAPGDAVLLYSSCLYSSVNSAGEPFGMLRIEESFSKSPGDKSARDMVDSIIKDFFAFTGSERLQDDLTAVLIKRTV
ncbi:MAG: PP2C family protein-serine/threonine phosphatase, partial [Spirochaetota bacterium]